MTTRTITVEALAAALLDQESHTCSDDMSTCAAAIFAALPAEPADTGLREALERLVEAQNTLDRAVTDEQMVAAVNGLEPAMKQARAALAASPSAGVDVERLARALMPALRNFYAQYDGWSDDEALADVLAYVAPNVAAAYDAERQGEQT